MATQELPPTRLQNASCERLLLVEAWKHDTELNLMAYRRRGGRGISPQNEERPRDWPSSLLQQEERV